MNGPESQDIYQQVTSWQWCSQGQNLKAKARTFEANAKAMSFKRTASAEIKICSTSHSLTEGTREYGNWKGLSRSLKVIDSAISY